MKSLDDTIKQLFEQQAPGTFESERQFRKEIDAVAAQLFTSQPKKLGLPQEAFQALVVALQKDGGVPLWKLNKKLPKLKKISAS